MVAVIDTLLNPGLLKKMIGYICPCGPPENKLVFAVPTSRDRILSAIFCALGILGNTLIALRFGLRGRHIHLLFTDLVLILLLPALGLRRLKLRRSKALFLPIPDAQIFLLCLMLPFAILFLLPPPFVSRPRPPSPVNSEKLPVAGFRWRMEQGGAPACSIRTGNDRSHSRQAPAGAAIPLGERTMAAGHTTARIAGGE